MNSGAVIEVKGTGSHREVYIDGIKQNNILKVETEILHDRIVNAKITYKVNKLTVEDKSIKNDTDINSTD